jgi:hypothetical protein
MFFKNRVNSLRVLAAEACYQSIISDFDLIFMEEKVNDDEVDKDQGHEPAEKKVKVVEDETDYLLNQKERDEALNELMKKLDYYLIGPFSAERQQFVDRFIKSYTYLRKPSDVNSTLVLAFFNCLLNGDITCFNLTEREEEGHPFQKMIDPLKLLPIISQRCSNLQTLSLSFGVPGKVHSVPFVPTLCDTLKSFKCLTSLSLSWYTGAGTDFLIPFLAALGDVKLTSLHLDFDFPVGMEQLLALVLGRKRQLLPQQLRDQLRTDTWRWTDLQFSAHSVSPMCSTLLKLDLRLNEESIANKSYLVAFILRHFPKMQECLSRGKPGLDTVHAVCMLHQQLSDNLNYSITSQNSSFEHGFIEWTLNAPFRGNF